MTEYGAVGDEQTDKYQAIQDAMDDAYRFGSGVGVVYFPTPEESYLINGGKLTWKSEFLISPQPYVGAALEAGPDLTDPVIGNSAAFQNFGMWDIGIDGSNG